MRLIDADNLYDTLEQYYKSSGAQSHVMARNCLDAVCNAPTVPAVPLEPLCEWLAKTKTPPCEIGLIGFKCVDVSLNCSDYGKCWKMAFAKWMEEQDAKEKG